MEWKRGFIPSVWQSGIRIEANGTAEHANSKPINHGQIPKIIASAVVHSNIRKSRGPELFPETADESTAEPSMELPIDDSTPTSADSALRPSVEDESRLITDPISQPFVETTARPQLKSSSVPYRQYILSGLPIIPFFLILKSDIGNII